MEMHNVAETLLFVAFLCHAEKESNTALARAKGFERVKMHLEPAPNNSLCQRTKDNGCLPRQQVFQQALNTLSHCQGIQTKMGNSTLSGRLVMPQSRDHKYRGGGGGVRTQSTKETWVRPWRMRLHGICRWSTLCPPGQKKARRTRWTPSTGRRGTLTPFHECFHCL